MAGPAQRFPSNIIKISFPSIGGLVFFRVAQRWENDSAAIAPRAFVTGLPWDDFDMFEVVDGVNDPDITLELLGETVPVVNPVTDKMIAKYRYWAQYPKVGADHNTTHPDVEIIVVEEAQWTLVYNHIINFRLTPIMTRDAAIELYKGIVASEGNDPNLVGVALTNSLGNEFTSNEEFFIYANAAGWIYHMEPSSGGTSYKRDDAAVVVINLAKLFKDVPNDPVTGKKPATVEFDIELPHKTVSGGSLKWWIEASAWSAKQSDPPDPDIERRDFPVHDVEVPISGIPGAFNYEYHKPTFLQDAEEEDENIGTEVQKAHVTITFGVGAVVPKVEIELEDAGGGEG